MSDFATARRRMVETQLQPRGVRDPEVLRALGRVPHAARDQLGIDHAPSGGGEITHAAAFRKGGKQMVKLVGARGFEPPTT